MHNTPSSTKYITYSPAPHASAWRNLIPFVCYGAAAGAFCYVAYRAFIYSATSILDTENRWWNWHQKISVAKLSLIDLHIVADEIASSLLQKNIDTNVSYLAFFREISSEEAQLESLLSWCNALKKFTLPYMRTKLTDVIEQIHEKNNRLMVIKRAMASHNAA